MSVRAPPRIRVLAVEDERDWVERIARALGDIVDLEFVESATLARAAVSSSAKYHVLLLDLVLPDGDGVDLLKWLRRGNFCGRVIVYTVRGNPHTLNQLAAFEGVRVLIKPAEDAEIQRCVASCVTTPDQIDGAVAEFIDEYDLSPRAGDDSRDAEVLRESAHGLNDLQVCEKLGMAHGTFRTHRHRILSKTRDDSLDQLVIRILLRAIRRG